MVKKLNEKRQQLMQEITNKHEPSIREINEQRKQIAAEVIILQSRDKVLRDEQLRLLKIRDEELEKARQAARG